MSTSQIPDKVKNELWARAAGICQFPGCKKKLFEELLTRAPINCSNIAHIVADSPKGPRGDKIKSKALASDISNLMLLCFDHHKLIDEKHNIHKYSVEVLMNYKKEQETWVERVTGLKPSNKTLIINFFSRIGGNTPLFHTDDYNYAISQQGHYPSTTNCLSVDLTKIDLNESEDSYWSLAKKQIDGIEAKIESYDSECKHISLFSLATMPLLMYLGKVLGDKRRVDVYQNHRDFKSWAWPDVSFETLDIQSNIDELIDKLHEHEELKVALHFSARPNADSINKVMPNFPLLEFYVDKPDLNIIRSPEHLKEFSGHIRKALDAILRANKEIVLHVFPVVPTSIAVEFGRLLMTNSDPKIKVYQKINQNYKYVLDLI